MSKFIGRQVSVGIAKETSRGGGNAPDFWIPKLSWSHEDKAIKATDLGDYANINAFGNQELVALKHAEGSLEMDMRDKSFGLLLLAVLGTLNTSGPSDSAYTHTFTLQNDNQHDSLAITVQDNDLGDVMFKLAMIEQLEMVITPDQLVRITVDFMSKPATTGVVATPSYAAENLFLGRHLTFKLASLTSGLSAASKIPLTSLTLRFIKRLRPDNVVGTVEPIDFINQAFSIEGEFTLKYEDRVYHDLMVNGTYRAMRINLNNAQTLIGATSTPQFTLDLSRVAFSEWESTRPNDEVTEQTIQFKALYDITNGNVINSCTLINAQSSY
jgi:hypothetical protein